MKLEHCSSHLRKIVMSRSHFRHLRKLSEVSRPQAMSLTLSSYEKFDNGCITTSYRVRLHLFPFAALQDDIMRNLWQGHSFTKQLSTIKLVYQPSKSIVCLQILQRMRVLLWTFTTGKVASMRTMTTHCRWSEKLSLKMTSPKTIFFSKWSYASGTSL